jgi:hypothetical protein
MRQGLDPSVNTVCGLTPVFCQGIDIGSLTVSGSDRDTDNRAASLQTPRMGAQPSRLFHNRSRVQKPVRPVGHADRVDVLHDHSGHPDRGMAGVADLPRPGSDGALGRAEVRPQGQAMGGVMAHHKRRRPKSARAGCLMCKPWKHQRARNNWGALQTAPDKRRAVDARQQREEYHAAA